MYGTETPLQMTVTVGGSRCVCVLAHTYCGTFMLLENGGDIIGVFLFLLCVVLHQWRSFGSPAPGFLCQQA